MAVLASGCTAERATTEPPLVSLQESQRDATQAMVNCLKDAGWDVALDPVTGSTDIELPEDQFDSYVKARTTCVEAVETQFPVSPLTDAQMREIYDYEVWLSECLRGEGVTVPEIPSSQAFIDAYRGGEPWLSYSFVGDVNEETYRSLMLACPQL
ncbi:MAG: hypothetical protein K2X36_02150 [Microbacteriaceae bacterium]|nr:hypothetical protein [Microbacteriaceae bacterium]